MCQESLCSTSAESLSAAVSVLRSALRVQRRAQPASSRSALSALAELHGGGRWPDVLTP